MPDDKVVQPLRPMLRLQKGVAAVWPATDPQTAHQLGLVPDADLPQLTPTERATCPLLTFSGRPSPSGWAHQLGLVPDADLPQLNATVKGGGQVLHQRPEVHPALTGEKEEELAAVKGALTPYQLHLQAVLTDFGLADVKGFLFPLPVALYGFPVPVGGQAEHGAQRLDHLIVRHKGNKSGVPASGLCSVPLCCCGGGAT
mgnify:CR=1 FL=1